MRNEGVTILQIVITVIIMIIILSVSIYMGPNIAREAKLASTYEEIKEIESTIEELYILGNVIASGDNIIFYGEKEAPKVDNTMYTAELGEDAEGEYYYLDFTSSRQLENVLGLENVDNDYIFDLDNLNIYLVGGIDIINEDGRVVIKYDSNEIVDYYSETFVK